MREVRYVTVGPLSPGMAGIWDKMSLADGLWLDERLDALAAMVCREDPRTKENRRADASIALVAGQSALACVVQSGALLAVSSRHRWRRW